MAVGANTGKLRLQAGGKGKHQGGGWGLVQDLAEDLVENREVLVIRCQSKAKGQNKGTAGIWA